MMVNVAPVMDRVRLAILAALVAVSLVASTGPVSAANISFGPLELIDPNNITWERSAADVDPDKGSVKVKVGGVRLNVTWE